jgi:hypothetical protein
MWANRLRLPESGLAPLLEHTTKEWWFDGCSRPGGVKPELSKHLFLLLALSLLSPCCPISGVQTSQMIAIKPADTEHNAFLERGKSVLLSGLEFTAFESAGDRIGGSL